MLTGVGKKQKAWEVKRVNTYCNFLPMGLGLTENYILIEAIYELP
jgi:hypothetical protein